jgi:ADP-ribose pyrophosphatase YjhB (NUDIX family)
MNFASFLSGHMVCDPAAQHRATIRILAANLGANPAQAVHDLGLMPLPDGASVRLYARHAADAIIIDSHDQILLITRANDPGAGKLALPGGFIDEINGAAEVPLATAIREAHEETGIVTSLLTHGTPVGHRTYDRPFDIRAAWNDPPGTPIKKGEWFGVSTQGFCFLIPGDLHDITIAAGDDAKHAAIYHIARLTLDDFAVPDHLPMIKAAMAAVRVAI